MLAQKRANLKGEVEHAAALVDAERCMAAKAVAEEELEQAAPALNHAVLLLNALRASDVAEVRALDGGQIAPGSSVKDRSCRSGSAVGSNPNVTFSTAMLPPSFSPGDRADR